MRIRFLHDVVYETEGRLAGQRFSAGDVVELRDDLAERWIRREKAEVVTAEPVVEPAPVVQHPRHRR